MNLKLYLHTNNIRVKDIVDLCGVQRNTVYRWVSGKVSVPLGYQRLIALFNHASLDTYSKAMVDVAGGVTATNKKSSLPSVEAWNCDEIASDYAARLNSGQELTDEEHLHYVDAKEFIYSRAKSLGVV